MINTKKELLKKLRLKNISELKKEKNQKQLLTLITNKKIKLSNNLFRSILKQVPDLMKPINNLIETMGTVAEELNETRRMRWEVLRDLAKSGSLDGEQCIEAMKIIRDMENNENIDWGRVFERVLYVLGIIVIIVFNRGRRVA